MHSHVVKPRGRIHQGVQGTHSNGRVIRDGSIPPSMLECICPFFFSVSVSFFLSFSFFHSLSLSLKLRMRTLKPRSYVQYLQKHRAGGKDIRANQLHFMPAKRAETRRRRISHFSCARRFPLSGRGRGIVAKYYTDIF